MFICISMMISETIITIKITHIFITLENFLGIYLPFMYFVGKGDYSNLLPIFQSGYLEIISEFWFSDLLWVQVLYKIYICKYFLLVCGIYFHSFNCLLTSKAFNFDEVQIISFFFYGLCFCSYKIFD